MFEKFFKICITYRIFLKFFHLSWPWGTKSRLKTEKFTYFEFFHDNEIRFATFDHWRRGMKSQVGELLSRAFDVISGFLSSRSKPNIRRKTRDLDEVVFY